MCVCRVPSVCDQNASRADVVLRVRDIRTTSLAPPSFLVYVEGSVDRPAILPAFFSSQTQGVVPVIRRLNLLAHTLTYTHTQRERERATDRQPVI